ncbi:MAG: ATP-grasp domain-containing protein [Propionicimonas sp.]
MPNVLVFPCGSEIGLEIHNSLKYAKDIRLVGLSSVPSHGEYVYRNYERIDTSVGDPGFLDDLRRVIEKWRIDFIYPAFDPVIDALSQLAPDQLAGAELLGSPSATNLLTRSKSRTYDALAGHPFVPRQFTPDTAGSADFPVFLKPDAGYGSRKVAIAHDPEELRQRLAADPELIAVELLPGREFTVDCFTDRHRRLLFVGPRVRNRIRNGISVSSTTVELTPEVQGIAEALNQAFPLRGQWFFQVKEAADGRLKLLEVAPRVAGTMNLYRSRGVNFALLSVLDRMGLDVAVLDNGFTATVDRALANRHRLDLRYDAVYVDFDDTLVVDGRVNVQLLSFLYQARHEGKEIVLLTRHAADIHQSLEKFAIAPQLFTRIAHLGDTGLKSDHVEHRAAIFIDDSYRERQDVHQRTGAFAFDVDAVESLLDWRY